MIHIKVLIFIDSEHLHFGFICKFRLLYELIIQNQQRPKKLFWLFWHFN